MEMIVIAENKLKVMMTFEDMTEFDLRAEDLDYANTETKRMLWDLLDYAKRHVGFNTDGHRVLVQLYPSKEGGCELFITKIAPLTPIDRDETLSKDTSPLLHYKPSHKKSTEKSRVGVFSFDRLESLLSVCRRLRGIGYADKSEAHVSDEGRYYLFLDGLDATGYLSLDEFSFVTEYGTKENTEAVRGLLAEHGRVICREEAVSTLGVL